MNGNMTEKQFALLMRLLRSRHIDLQNDINFSNVHKLNKIEASEVIKALIEAISYRKQKEYDFEVMQKHEGTPIEEMRDNEIYERD